MSNVEDSKSFDHRIFFRQHSLNNSHSYASNRDSTGSGGGLSASTWRAQQLPSTSGSDTNTSFNPSQHYFRSSSSASQSSQASTLSSRQSLPTLQQALHAPADGSPSAAPTTIAAAAPRGTSLLARQFSHPPFFSVGGAATSSSAAAEPRGEHSGSFFARQFSHPSFLPTFASSSGSNAAGSGQAHGGNRITNPINGSPRHGGHGAHGGAYQQRHSAHAFASSPFALHPPPSSSASSSSAAASSATKAADPKGISGGFVLHGERVSLSSTQSASTSSFHSTVGTARRYWRCVSCKELDWAQYRRLLGATLALNVLMMVTEILRVRYIALHGGRFDHIIADGDSRHADEVALILSLVATVLTFSNCLLLLLLLLDPRPRLAVLAAGVTLLLELIYVVQAVLYYATFARTRALLVVTVVFLVVQLCTAWLLYRVWEFSFFNYETNAASGLLRSMLADFQQHGDHFWAMENGDAHDAGAAADAPAALSPPPPPTTSTMAAGGAAQDASPAAAASSKRSGSPSKRGSRRRTSEAPPPAPL